jgi:hypothetical protein
MGSGLRAHHHLEPGRRPVPEGLFRSAGYLEVFGENGPRKDRTGSGRSLARERYPELSVVVDVMLS